MAKSASKPASRTTMIAIWRVKRNRFTDQFKKGTKAMAKELSLNQKDVECLLVGNWLENLIEKHKNTVIQ